MDEKSEREELSARLRGGDQEALAAVFSRYRQQLWRMVNFRMDRRLFGRLDPDDVLQEAYVTMAARIEDFGQCPSLSPLVWLRTMILQTLTDLNRHHLGAQMRAAGREVVRGEDLYPQTTSVSLAAQFAASVTSPSQAAVRAELFQQAQQAMAELDPIDQEVLALRHFEELGNGEVAEILGIQEKAASIRYVRALKRLKGVLSRIPGVVDGDSHG